jgi:hypothetical protein
MEALGFEVGRLTFQAIRVFSRGPGGKIEPAGETDEGQPNPNSKKEELMMRERLLDDGNGDGRGVKCFVVCCVRGRRVQ